MKFEYRDGSKIEILGASATHPPGHTGMRAGIGLWARIAGDAWIKVDRRLSINYAHKLAEMADSAREAMSVLVDVGAGR